MFSFEFNKFAGAILGACVFAMALGIVADAIYSNGKPAKPGYDLPEPKAEAPAEKPVAAVPLPVLLAKADATKGQADTKVCQACHNFEKGAGVKVGPPLYGVVDRPKGSVAGFDYSAGMKAKGGNWTFEDLDAFITNPKGYVTGTKMGYAGEPEASKRADIIVYLRSLSDTPAALPAAAAEAAKPAADAKPDTKAAAPSPAAPKAAAPAGKVPVAAEKAPPAPAAAAAPPPAPPAPPAPAAAPPPPAPEPPAPPSPPPPAPAAAEPTAGPASAEPGAGEPYKAADPQYPAEQPPQPASAPAAAPELPPLTAAPGPADSAPGEPYKAADPQYPAEQK